MKAARMLKSQAGFSLIELMIVVAIIGILATVAIPNFTRFQAKARQSGGKTLLAGYFSAQKATYSEFTYFPGNLPGAGYKPEGQLVYRLIAADNAAAAGSATTNPADTGNAGTCVGTNSTVANCAATGLVPGTTWVELATGAACTGSAAGGAMGAAGTFTACVGATIGGATGDTWTINEVKLVNNTSNGLP